MVDEQGIDPASKAGFVGTRAIEERRAFLRGVLVQSLEENLLLPLPLPLFGCAHDFSDFFNSHARCFCQMAAIV